jgi:hypothetical protein
MTSDERPEKMSVIAVFREYSFVISSQALSPGVGNSQYSQSQYLRRMI